MVFEFQLSDNLDNYTIEDIKYAIKRCEDNIQIFTDKVNEQTKLKTEWELMLVQKQTEEKLKNKK